VFIIAFFIYSDAAQPLTVTHELCNSRLLYWVHGMWRMETYTEKVEWKKEGVCVCVSH